MGAGKYRKYIFKKSLVPKIDILQVQLLYWTSYILHFYVAK